MEPDAEKLKTNASDSVRLVRAHYEPGEITTLRDQEILTANTTLSGIAQIPPEKRTIQNTLLQFDQIISELCDTIMPLTVMGYVYPDITVSAEGMKAEEMLKTFLFNVYTRRDLYNILKNLSPTTPEETRLLNHTLREYKKNGLELSDEQITVVRGMREKLTNLEREFSENLNNDNTTLEFTAEELTGVPAEKMNSFSRTDTGSYQVTTKYPDYYPVMDNAASHNTRRRLYSAFVNRQAENNTRLLEEAIQLRQKIAKNLGYDTWAAYKIEGRMAETPKNVLTFLNSLKRPLQTKIHEETALLLTLKQNDDPQVTTLDPWDIRYYTEQLKKQRYSVYTEKIREYFPLDRVREGMFALYGELLGIGFERVDGVEVWSPEVTLYRIINTSDHRIIAYVYLDLFPREGKFGHLMMCPLNAPRNREDGSYVIPLSVIVGNMQAPNGDRPSLLSFDDVEGLFHEFGHILHGSLTSVPYGILSGTNVEMDFVETPSQVMEEWIWTPEIIDLVSGHYLNQSEQLPAEIRENLIASRDIDIGLTYGRQWVIAQEDMDYNTMNGPVNITSLADARYKEMMGIDPIEGGHDPATIGHLAGGYDAGYYSYLWSKIYALNVFSRFKKEGIRNPTTGKDFRNWILEQGNMEDGKVLLRGFLGAEPNSDEFFTRLTSD